MTPWWVALASTVIGVVGGWFVKRTPEHEPGGSRENKLIDQLQEELSRARELEREKVERLETGQKELKARMGRMESRELMWRQYTFELQAHIIAQKPPPPPEFPAGLLGMFTIEGDI